MQTKTRAPEGQNSEVIQTAPAVAQQRLVCLVGGRWVVGPGVDSYREPNPPEGGRCKVAFAVIMRRRGDTTTSRFLVGPRGPQEVRKNGYAFTDHPGEAWLFATYRQARHKARLLARHMTRGVQNVQSDYEFGVNERVLIEANDKDQATRGA